MKARAAATGREIRLIQSRNDLIACAPVPVSTGTGAQLSATAFASGVRSARTGLRNSPVPPTTMAKRQISTSACGGHSPHITSRPQPRPSCVVEPDNPLLTMRFFGACRLPPPHACLLVVVFIPGIQSCVFYLLASPCCRSPPLRLWLIQLRTSKEPIRRFHQPCLAVGIVCKPLLDLLEGLVQRRERGLRSATPNARFNPAVTMVAPRRRWLPLLVKLN